MSLQKIDGEIRRSMDRQESVTVELDADQEIFETYTATLPIGDDMDSARYKRTGMVVVWARASDWREFRIDVKYDT